jgi:O-antigen ligase
MNNNPAKTSPATLFATALVFLFPLLALVTKNGISISSFLFLLAAIALFKASGAVLREHWSEIRWVVIAFGAYFAYHAISLGLRPDADLGWLEKPSRMLFAATALLVVVALRPAHKWLWRGIAGGAILGLGLISWQRINLQMARPGGFFADENLWFYVDRPGGFFNAITFGDLSLALGLLSLAGAVELRGRRELLLPLAGALAGLLGCLMTGTRGGWVALIFCGMLFLRYSRLLKRRVVVGIAAAVIGIFAVALSIPESGLKERVGEGISDVRTYMDGGNVYTRMGVRLELWRSAVMLAEEKPVFGYTYQGYKDRTAQWAAEGKVDQAAVAPFHLHNDALQNLVVGGAVGLLLWMATLAVPFLWFRRAMHDAVNRSQQALALAGMVLVVGYFSFGLTEVIFWSVGGSMFYALMLFLLMGFSINAKGQHAI